MLFPSKPRSSNYETKPRVLFLPSQRTVALSASVRTLRPMPSSDVGCAFWLSSIQSESPSTAAIRVGQATNRIAPARNKCAFFILPCSTTGAERLHRDGEFTGGQFLDAGAPALLGASTIGDVVLGANSV